MTTCPVSRDDCVALDAADPLASLREQFHLPPGLIYLDGNSLGPLPRSAPRRMAQALQQQWGDGLIGSWNSAGWLDLPTRVGDKIARLVGARPGEVVAADSTSVNLFKVMSAALAGRGSRRVILSERGNFPTDLYIAQGLIGQLGNNLELRLVERADLPAAITDDVAVTMLTQVDYRTGSRLDMADITAAAHRAGALAVWDLAHSAGAFDVDLNGCQVDYAVGCGYKYLNGGPGSPAFVFAAARHHATVAQPLSGWIGHAAPFAFEPGYRPAPGIGRFLCGTPPVLSLAALEAGVDAMLAALPLGGLSAVRAKSLALTDLFIALVASRCQGHGLSLLTPLEHRLRGSQVSYSVPDGDQAHALVQALIAHGVVGDFRAPDVMRFGVTPLYLRFADVWDAVEQLHQLLTTGAWKQDRFIRRQAVT